MRIKRYVGVILQDTQGRLVLQKRENKPGVIAPGEISTFGGEIEDGETTYEAAIRELKEELDLSLTKEDLFFLYAWPPEDEEDHQVKRTILILRRQVEPEELKLQEGEAIVYLPATADLNDPQLKINKFTKKAIQKFKESF